MFHLCSLLLLILLLLSFIVDNRTLAKISISGTKFLDVLLKDFDINNIPTMYGGKYEDNHSEFHFDITPNGPFYSKDVKVPIIKSIIDVSITSTTSTSTIMTANINKSNSGNCSNDNSGGGNSNSGNSGSGSGSPGVTFAVVTKESSSIKNENKRTSSRLSTRTIDVRRLSTYNRNDTSSPKNSGDSSSSSINNSSSSGSSNNSDEKSDGNTNNISTLEIPILWMETLEVYDSLMGLFIKHPLNSTIFLIFFAVCPMFTIEYLILPLFFCYYISYLDMIVLR